MDIKMIAIINLGGILITGYFQDTHGVEGGFIVVYNIRRPAMTVYKDSKYE